MKGIYINSANQKNKTKNIQKKKLIEPIHFYKNKVDNKYMNIK